jgi:5,5'-dehydrodivanillate O-demethylase oxygenase subunit
MENSVDPVHLEWLHGHHLSAVRSAGGEAAPTRYLREHREIGFEVFRYGIVKRRLLVGGSREDDDWRIGHPLVFPLMVRVGTHRQHRFQIRVPMDDTHTLHLWYSCYVPPRGSPPLEQGHPPVYDVPFRDEHGFITDFVDGGDIMAWVTQGPIANRTRELLSDTDRGVVLLRQLLLEQIEKVAAAEDPIGVLRPPAGDAVIELAQEADKYGDGARFLSEAIDATHVRYSPLRDRIMAVLAAPDR